MSTSVGRKQASVGWGWVIFLSCVWTVKFFFFGCCSPWVNRKIASCCSPFFHPTSNLCSDFQDWNKYLRAKNLFLGIQVQLGALAAFVLTERGRGHRHSTYIFKSTFTARGKRWTVETMRETHAPPSHSLCWIFGYKAHKTSACQSLLGVYYGGPESSVRCKQMKQKPNKWAADEWRRCGGYLRRC